jgi:hypothetical protein
MQTRFAQFGKMIGSCLMLQISLILAIGLIFGINPLSPNDQQRLDQLFDRSTSSASFLGS